MYKCVYLCFSVSPDRMQKKHPHIVYLLSTRAPIYPDTRTLKPAGTFLLVRTFSHYFFLKCYQATWAGEGTVHPAICRNLSGARQADRQGQGTRESGILMNRLPMNRVASLHSPLHPDTDNSLTAKSYLLLRSLLF